MRFVDLFCGIGAFHTAMRQVCEERGEPFECVLAADTDPHARRVYTANYGVAPLGDVRDLANLPEHEILCAGFPCQSFSRAGLKEGLADARGGLIFEVVRLLRAAQPPAFVIENVRDLVIRDALPVICAAFADAGYTCEHRVLDALDFGVPQHRERLFIVGFRHGHTQRAPFEWPANRAVRADRATDHAGVLDQCPSPRHFLSTDARARLHRCARNTQAAADSASPAAVDSTTSPTTVTTWTIHKDRVSAKPYARTLRSYPSYNYLTIDGERRPSEREMLRLMGFAASFALPRCGYRRTQRLVGNSIVVPVAAAVLRSVLDALPAAG
jgi:DNA (cytosine-5)-methyltransferase 1